MSIQIKMYSTRYCPYCTGARSLFKSKNLAYDDIGVDGNPELRREMIAHSGRHTVPQIWVGDHHVGGFDELRMLEQQGRLDELINPA